MMNAECEIWIGKSGRNVERTASRLELARLLTTLCLTLDCPKMSGKIDKQVQIDRDDTTLHEMLEERLESLKKWQKIGYNLVLFVLVTILLVQITQLMVKYNEAPTYVTTDIVEQREAAFPAITICPEGDKYKSDVLKVSRYACH